MTESRLLELSQTRAGKSRTANRSPNFALSEFPQFKASDLTRWTTKYADDDDMYNSR